MIFDHSKLMGRVVEMCGTRKECANKVGMNETTFSMKLSNNSSFTREDIIKLMPILDIKPEEIGIYFFKLKVQDNEPLEE